MKLKSINLLAVITIPLSLWVGFSGQLSWWAILLIWLMSMSINLSLQRKTKTISFWKVDHNFSSKKLIKWLVVGIFILLSISWGYLVWRLKNG